MEIQWRERYCKGGGGVGGGVGCLFHLSDPDQGASEGGSKARKERERAREEGTQTEMYFHSPTSSVRELSRARIAQDSPGPKSVSRGLRAQTVDQAECQILNPK